MAAKCFAFAIGAVLAFPLMASAQTAAKSAPTFTKDIAPIFQEKCEACHRPDSIAPMSLVNFEEARPWARSIKTRVATRQMPPWHIDKSVGIQKVQNDRSLTDQQIEMILRHGSTPAHRRATPKTCRLPSSGQTIRSGTSKRSTASPISSSSRRCTRRRPWRRTHSTTDRIHRPHRAPLGARD